MKRVAIAPPVRARTQQKGALIRAINSGDPAAVEAEGRRVVAEWRRSTWPDDWTLWQRRLDDELGPNAPRLESL
jgi:hypothetical protein